jgi:hypothetical protein
LSEKVLLYDVGGTVTGGKMLIFRKQKAGGRDGGECSDADERFLMSEK